MGNKLNKLSNRNQRNVEETVSRMELSPYDNEIFESGIFTTAFNSWHRLIKCYPNQMNDILLQCLSQTVPSNTDKTGGVNVIRQINYILDILNAGDRKSEMESICKYMFGLWQTFHISFDNVNNVWQSFQSLFPKLIGSDALDLGEEYCLNVVYIFVVSLIFSVKEWAAHSDSDNDDEDDDSKIIDIGSDIGDNNSRPTFNSCPLKLTLTRESTEYSAWSEDIDSLLSLSRPKSCIKFISNPIGMAYLGKFLRSVDASDAVLGFIRDYHSYTRYDCWGGGDGETTIAHARSLGDLFVAHYLDILINDDIITSFRKHQIENDWFMTTNNAEKRGEICNNTSFHCLFLEVCRWLDETYLTSFYDTITLHHSSADAKKPSDKPTAAASTAMATQSMSNLFSRVNDDTYEDSIQLFT